MMMMGDYERERERRGAVTMATTSTLATERGKEAVGFYCSPFFPETTQLVQCAVTQ